MTKARLQDLTVEAEAKLGPEAQERLAEVVDFVASGTAEPDFTPEAMARLREIDAEPFEAADPAEFEAFSGSVAQVAFSPRALACPRSVRQYLQERDPAAAARVIGEMERVCALIGAYPRTGPPIPGTGMRRQHDGSPDTGSGASRAGAVRFPKSPVPSGDRRRSAR